MSDATSFEKKRLHMEDEDEDEDQENEKEDERDGAECRMESRRASRQQHHADDTWMTCAQDAPVLLRPLASEQHCCMKNDIIVCSPFVVHGPYSELR